MTLLVNDKLLKNVKFLKNYKIDNSNHLNFFAAEFYPKPDHFSYFRKAMY